MVSESIAHIDPQDPYRSRVFREILQNNHKPLTLTQLPLSSNSFLSKASKGGMEVGRMKDPIF